MPIITCAYCGKKSEKSVGAINRAAKAGLSLYCNRTCSGLGRRKGKTLEQKREEKRLYDLNYRATSPTLKARKAAYHKKAYDPAKAAKYRKENMPRHLEYCRQPEYRAKKKEYDRVYRAEKHYGEFADAFLTLLDLEFEVIERAEKPNIAAVNGTLNKKQTRRREYERLNSNKP